MTRVECHPNFNVPADERCVSVHPLRKRAHTYLMGSVTLTNVEFKVNEGSRLRAVREQVKNVHAWIVGNIVMEHTIQIPLEGPAAKHMVPVTYHYNIGRFLTIDPDPGKVIDVTDGEFAAAYCVGRRLYISKEW